MTTISIHQPVYLPWLGFFGKIISSDIFVILDDVQYEKMVGKIGIRLEPVMGILG